MERNKVTNNGLKGIDLQKAVSAIMNRLWLVALISVGGENSKERLS